MTEPEKQPKQSVKGKQGFQKILKVVNGKRICSNCKVEKDIDNFLKRVDHPGNRRGVCRECFNAKTRVIWWSLKKRILDYYGHQCQCCGEDDDIFLTIDHINNDGYKDKYPGGMKKTGKNLYKLIEKAGYPDKFQVLCHNCNFGKKVSKVCPHQKKNL